jgi:hypothetical protein
VDHTPQPNMTPDKAGARGLYGPFGRPSPTSTLLSTGRPPMARS